MNNDSLSSLMPSNFLKTADFENGEERTFTIAGIVTEKVQEDSLPVLRFDGEDKGLILKSTNIQTLQELFGNSRAALKGKEVVVYKDPNVSFAGKRTGGLRLKASGNGAQTGKAGNGTSQVTGSVDLKDRIRKEFARIGFNRAEAAKVVSDRFPGKESIKDLTTEEMAALVPVLEQTKGMEY